MTTEYLNINGIPAKLYIAENASGTVLAVHGFGGSKESGAISALAEYVCPKGLNVLSYDLPAHGERTEKAEALAIAHCISEIILIEQYIHDHFSGDLYAFATSFGGLCMLYRIARNNDPYRKVVLRVPAVNMSETLITISKMCDPEFTMQKAEKNGFFIRMSRDYVIPHRFYNELCNLSCLRNRDEWNDSRIMTIYAENDELVSLKDTEAFLACNPEIKSLLIKGSDHRMAADPKYLEQALEAASEHLLT